MSECALCDPVLIESLNNIVKTSYGILSNEEIARGLHHTYTRAGYTKGFDEHVLYDHIKGLHNTTPARVK